MLDKAEKAYLAALKARSKTERAIHLLWPQAVDGLVAIVKADQHQMAAYTKVIGGIKMPGAV